MMEVAVFGAGRIGKIHAGNLVREPGVRLKYVSDVNAQAAQELAARYGAQVANIDTALADPAIGAVLIASSTDTHRSPSGYGGVMTSPPCAEIRSSVSSPSATRCQKRPSWLRSPISESWPSR